MKTLEHLIGEFEIAVVNECDALAESSDSGYESAAIRTIDARKALLAECLPPARKHTLNADKTAAVSTDVFWLPIDEHTPRNVKVFAIARSGAGIAQTTELRQDETWYTHWHPVPKFRT